MIFALFLLLQIDVSFEEATLAEWEDFVPPGNYRFSADGRHVYWIGRRVGQEDEFLYDNGKATVTAYHMLPVYPGPDGTSVAFRKPVDYMKWAMVLNGKDGETFDEVKAPSFSADAKRFSYFARERKNWFVVLNDKRIGPYEELKGFDDAPMYGPDARVVYAAKIEKRWRLFVGEEKSEPFEGIVASGYQPPAFSADGKSLAYVAKKDKRRVIVFNGHLVGSEYDDVRCPVLSRDGKTLVYAALKEKLWSLVGVEEPGPASEDTPDIVLSPDGRTVAYTAKRGKGAFVVVGSKAGEEFDYVDRPVFSPDGKRTAYVGRRDGKASAVVDGVRGDEYERAYYLVFSPDSRTVAYAAERDGHEYIVIGESGSSEYRDVSRPIFSSDGRKVAFGAVKDGRFLWRVLPVK